MVNLNIPAPFETEKSTYIHDRTTRPAAPATSRPTLAKRWSGFLAGVLLSVALTAVLFSLRDSWGNHREWLVTTIPMLAIAAVALGHLTARGQAKALVTGGLFLILALLFMGLDIYADNDNASMTIRNTYSILGGIALGISVVALMVALLWVEIANPTRAPKPEM